MLSATRKNKILPFVTTQMDLEVFMLNEISQIEKDKYCMLSLIRNLKNKVNEYNKTETDSSIQRTN